MGARRMDLDRWDYSEPAIWTVHDDLIRAQILTRLDGPGLASASCASSRLHSLVASDSSSLWAEACRAAWPSTSSPLLAEVISSFPSGHRSFFSDSYPPLIPDITAATADSSVHSGSPSELISAVDLFYEDRLLLSRVVLTETRTSWFGSSPLRIDALGPKESVPTKAGGGRSSDACRDLGEGMRLSWILVDQEGRRAVNVSSGEPVEVQRHWLTGDVRVKFATTVAVASAEDGEGSVAQCGIVVTCQEGGEGEGVAVRVSEVSLQVEDVEGVVMSGRDSVGILTRVMRGGRGRGKLPVGEGRRRYGEFERRKREAKERRLREGRLDVVFVAIGVLIYVVFWGFVCCR